MSDTVLLVDNEEHNLNSMHRLFAEDDMRVLRAACPQTALEFFSKEEIAVILSANQIPEMSGIELLSKVRDLSPYTLRIVMTGHADLITAVDAINKGEIFRFILKPWNGDALKQTVREAVQRYHTIQAMRKNDESTLLSLAQAIESTDPFTPGHCENVAGYAVMIAEAITLPEEKIKDLKYGSWLHDCGKIGVPEKILNKSGQLTENEFEIVKNHPRLGSEIAQEANLSQSIINVILRHHEKYDGSGYPSGLKGNDIPLESRIVTIADVYDALTADRPYRKKFNVQKATEIMYIMRKSVFDPELLDIFLHKCLKVAT